MKRIFKLGLLAAVMAFVLLSSALYASEDKAFLLSRVSEVQDARLRSTLENSIKVGLINNSKELDAALKKDAISRKKNNNSNLAAIRAKISEQAAPLKGLDKDKISVTKNDKGNKLFGKITGEVPASYKKFIALSAKFDPKTNTSELPHNEKAITDFFNSIKDDPTIKHALKVTNTTIQDMQRNWFSKGAGFEHVFSGEVKGSKVSGYHFWYKFYDDEAKGYAKKGDSMAGIGNPRIFTGSFTWQPNGKGGDAFKRKGGFTIGHSPQILLALGHIAIEAAKSEGAVPSAYTFYADINGESFLWQMYTLGGSIRSLYPMAPQNKK
ncbi:MAG: hypothetical protein GX221_10570 [Candidatus Riflebacteria bacterium]|nr:hypothetical protein [Candidatus Riflebacteria bacterium]